MGRDTRTDPLAALVAADEKKFDAFTGGWGLSWYVAVDATACRVMGIDPDMAGNPRVTAVRQYLAVSRGIDPERSGSPGGTGQGEAS